MEKESNSRFYNGMIKAAGAAVLSLGLGCASLESRVTPVYGIDAKQKEAIEVLRRELLPNGEGLIQLQSGYFTSGIGENDLRGLIGILSKTAKIYDGRLNNHKTHSFKVIKGYSCLESECPKKWKIILNALDTNGDRIITQKETAEFYNRIEMLREN